MKGATEVLDRAKTSRMEILRKAAEEYCGQQYEGMWLQCACEIITNNNIHPHVLAAALRDLIEHGRGKFRNIIIIGQVNCGQSLANMATTNHFYNI